MNFIPKKPASHSRSVLIAGIAIALTWGGLVACRSTTGRESLNERLREVITDEGKLSKLEEIISRRNSAQDEFMSGRRKLTEQLLAANSDYDCEPDKLDAIVAQFDETWIVFREQVISTALELRETTTESEWQALAPADIEAVLSESVLTEQKD